VFVGSAMKVVVAMQCNAMHGWHTGAAHVHQQQQQQQQGQGTRQDKRLVQTTASDTSSIRVSSKSVIQYVNASSIPATPTSHATPRHATLRHTTPHYTTAVSPCPCPCPCPYSCLCSCSCSCLCACSYSCSYLYLCSYAAHDSEDE
jgi:hypothetical protein